MPTHDLAAHCVEPRDLAPGVWERLTRGSFFASLRFLDLWSTRRGRTVAWVVEVGGAPAAMIPGVEFGRGPLARFVSLPDGCYGGVFTDPAIEDERARLSRALFEGIRRRRYAKALVFDFAGLAGSPASFTLERAETVLTDISPANWQPADPKLRSQIRRAEREGIRVEPFDWAKHHAGFLSLVRGTARHHGVRPRYAPAFYRALARLAARDPRIRWLFCEHEGQAAASHVYFVDGDMLQAWQSHFNRTFAFLKPNAYLRFMQCRSSAREGVRWLNLGSTPAGADGIAHYKARWGTRRVQFGVWTRTERVGRLADLILGRGTALAAIPDRRIPYVVPAP